MDLFQITDVEKLEDRELIKWMQERIVEGTGMCGLLLRDIYEKVLLYEPCFNLRYKTPQFMSKIDKNRFFDMRPRNYHRT